MATLRYLLLSFVLISCSSQILRYEEKDFVSHQEYQEEVKIVALPTEPTAKPISESKTQKVAAKPSAPKTGASVPGPTAKTTIKAPSPPKSQSKSQAIKSHAFLKPNQSFTILISYIGMTAGELTFTVKNPVMVNDKKAHHFLIEAKSLKIFEMVYKMNNTLDTYVDFETLTPFSYELDVKEPKKVRQARAIFDHKNKEVRYWEKMYNKKDGLRKIEETWPLEVDAQNAFSAQYYLRTLDFSKKNSHEIAIAHNKENLNVVVEKIKEEKVSTKLGDFDCWVVRPTVYLNGKVKPMGEVLYWISKDSKRLIVKLEAKIKIGTIKGEISKLNF